MALYISHSKLCHYIVEPLPLNPWRMQQEQLLDPLILENVFSL